MVASNAIFKQKGNRCRWFFLEGIIFFIEDNMNVQSNLAQCIEFNVRWWNANVIYSINKIMTCELRPLESNNSDSMPHTHRIYFKQKKSEQKVFISHIKESRWWSVKCIYCGNCSLLNKMRVRKCIYVYDAFFDALSMRIQRER